MKTYYLVRYVGRRFQGYLLNHYSDDTFASEGGAALVFPDVNTAHSYLVGLAEPFRLITSGLKLNHTRFSKN